MKDLKTMKEPPGDITPVCLEAVLTPTGEIVHRGKTVARFKTGQQFLIRAGEVLASRNK